MSNSFLTYGSINSDYQISNPFLAGTAGYMPELNQSVQLSPQFNPAATSAPLLPMMQVTPPAWYNFQPPLPVIQPPNQEHSGIALVHAMMECAESVQSGNLLFSGMQVEKLQALMTLINPSSGIGKVAGHFINALTRRIYSAQGFGSFPMMSSTAADDSLYHSFYVATPFLKFAHFTANHAIMEAINGRDCVHIIDFGFMQGSQWPALIQALAGRPGGPPALMITGVGSGRDSMNAAGLKLAKMAGEMNVKFEFRAVEVSRLDEIRPEMLNVCPGDAVVVNSVFQLHKLVGPEVDPVNGSPLKSVLSWVQALNPTIITVIEQEADLNQLGYLDRFTSALFYYSTLFDSLETCSAPREKALAELYLQKEIVDVLCFEGSARVERCEPLAKWKARFSEAGFQPMYMGMNIFMQASWLLSLLAASGYCVDEADGCLRLGWHNRLLLTASAWKPVPFSEQLGAVGDI